MSVLLTGTTGLVGQYLLRDLLQAGQPVAVLIRGQGKKTARERLEKILDHWQNELGRRLPAPYLLEGDICQEGLGLAAAERAWVSRNCRAMLHNAASLTFVGKDRAEEPWRSNYLGTAHVLDFCQECRIREFHYMSTAFVCGQRTDVVHEHELDMGQGFRNDYEHCKFEAEKLVRSARFLDRLTVYRPAIITGDSRTGYTSTYHGLYSFIQFIWLMYQIGPLDENGRLYYPVRFNLTGNELRNLVPVDWISAVATEVFCNPSQHGKTYHLAPPQPLLMREVLDSLERYFNFYGPTFAGRQPLSPDDMNEHEKIFYGYVARYEGYLSDEPLFDSRNTQAAAGHLPCPRLDADGVRRLIDYAIQDRFGKRREPRKQAIRNVSA